MRKNVAILAAALLAASALTACGGQTTETTAADTSAAETTAAGGEETAAAEEESSETAATGELETVTVGASPAPHAEILEAAKDAMAAKGYDLEIVEYVDYVQPNLA